MAVKIDIETFFDNDTSTFSYIVSDKATKKAVIIDSVLDYNQYSGRVDTESADKIIKYVKENNLSVEWVLDTHIHADHITASHYLKNKLGGKIGIGEKILDVLNVWIEIFNTSKDTKADGSQFDYLLKDGQILKFGETEIKVISTPGHTPACCSYLIEDNIFVGDTIFMPDIGTARTDFPGGDAATLYDSIKKIFSLADDTKIFMCHDYPPKERSIRSVCTVGEQKKDNILICDGISKSDYIKNRNKRDKDKEVPRLLLPSIQVNLRAGDFGIAEENNVKYIKIPINKI